MACSSEKLSLSHTAGSTSSSLVGRPSFFSTALGRRQVGAEHFVEGPARLEGIGKALAVSSSRPAHALHLVADHLQEAVLQLRIEVGILEHLGRGAVGQGRAAALGEGMEHLVALRFGLEVAGDVVEHQHEARHRASASPSVVLITGAICTRSNWPARVVVTKLATGWELWRRMRSWMLSACTIRLRSKTSRSTAPAR
jgi:hypothetical protein